MSLHKESEKEFYDVIVIGSGIGGLCAASQLARYGKSVLVVERHDRPGGYAHSFRRKAYRFDSGVHLTSGCSGHGYKGGQLIHKVLLSLGVAENVQFIPVNPIIRAVYPDGFIDTPQGIDQFVKAHSEINPDQEQGLIELVKLCEKVAEQLVVADEVISSGEPGKVRLLIPELMQHRKASLQQVMDQYIDDERVQSAFSSLWPYLGLPPSQVSFLYWASMLMGYVLDGAYYCKGTFQKYAEALVSGLEKYNGEIMYRSTVRRILVKDESVHGVVLENGQRIECNVVVSNADLRQTLYTMLGPQHLPEKYLDKIQQMTTSLSALVVYLAVEYDVTTLELAHESFFYEQSNHERNYQATLAGEIPWFTATVPSLVDSGLAPKGQHLILLTTLLPYDLGDSWRKLKHQYQKDLTDKFLARYPSLREHVVFQECGTPRTMERYTLNHDGAAYGWDVSPEQVGNLRLGLESPVKGLYFAGHWTQPGGGIYGVTVSGVRVAQKILGLKSQGELLQDHL